MEPDNVSHGEAPGPLVGQEVIPDAMWANNFLSNYMPEYVWRKNVTSISTLDSVTIIAGYDPRITKERSKEERRQGGRRGRR